MWRRLSAALLLGFLLCASDLSGNIGQSLDDPGDRTHPPADAADAGGELTAQEIELCLKVYDRSVALYSMLLSEEFQPSPAGIDFLEAFEKTKKLFSRAEQEACKEHGLEHSRYSATLKRLLLVQAYVQYTELRDMLLSQIREGEGMTEQDLQVKAGRSYRETEEWRAEFQEQLEAAKRKRDEEKQRYLERIEEANQEIDEYNRNLAPRPAVARLQERLAFERAKLRDPRYETMYEGIERAIAEMEEVLSRLEEKDRRRKKKKKKSDPLVLDSFDRPVKNLEQYIASLDSIVVKPVRDKRSDGQWFDVVKAAHENKLKELKGSLKRLNEFLSDPRFWQASADRQLVEQVVDREKLVALDSPLLEEVPRFP